MEDREVASRALIEMCKALSKKDPYLIPVDPAYWLNHASNLLDKEREQQAHLDVLFPGDKA